MYSFWAAPMDSVADLNDVNRNDITTHFHSYYHIYVGIYFEEVHNYKQQN